ncbi:hypothetical protein GGR95_002752 [Sulfitobacter undariae]|uniref:Uncharacterized protein n=1 Tax=Sulfitobacter undariae TaxID=1563671 RepID=A0A7W6H0M7_9RHOB|nr:hypothetical protein [Sulfitobacter undariae]MBB3995101.1 hypothetical protein [Sulfitobacter undariae]
MGVTEHWPSPPPFESLERAAVAVALLKRRIPLRVPISLKPSDSKAGSAAFGSFEVLIHAVINAAVASWLAVLKAPCAGRPVLLTDGSLVTHPAKPSAKAIQTNFINNLQTIFPTLPQGHVFLKAIWL